MPRSIQTVLRRHGDRALRFEAGFSLVELVIVVAILLVVSAVAVPNLMRTIAAVRVRSSADTVSGLMQKMRAQAVKDNKFYSGVSANLGDSLEVCVDLDYSGGCNAGDYVTNLASYTSWVPAGAAPDTTLITCGPTLGPAKCPAGYPPGLNFTPEPQTVLPSFSARGLPCVNPLAAATLPVWPAGKCQTLDPNFGGRPVGFLYLLQYTGTAGVSYSAVAVTPAGRVTSWTYGGKDANGIDTWSR